MRHIFELVKDIFSTVGRWICQMFFSFVRDETEPEENGFPTFVVSEYLDRMEKANLEIFEHRETVDKVIILWWGLDGLRLNEDGTLEWISRKKPEPVNQDVFCQSTQAAQGINPHVAYQTLRTENTRQLDGMIACQSQQAAISALQFQATQQMQNAGMIMELQSYCTTPYPYHYYGGEFVRCSKIDF